VVVASGEDRVVRIAAPVDEEVVLEEDDAVAPSRGVRADQQNASVGRTTSSDPAETPSAANLARPGLMSSQASDSG
jgi:hypothetical protein